MENAYLEVGVCGLSCRLCPSYYTETESRCLGCTSAGRIAVGCPFITCAVKRKGLAGCWECPEGETCAKWLAHRAASRAHDSFVCYQKLEANIVFIRAHGVEAFDQAQREHENLLRQMLAEFNEGRSKRYYCVAATVMELDDLASALEQARVESAGCDLKQKAQVLHQLLDAIAQSRGYCLRLRK